MWKARNSSHGANLLTQISLPAFFPKIKAKIVGLEGVERMGKKRIVFLTLGGDHQFKIYRNSKSAGTTEPATLVRAPGSFVETAGRAEVV